MPLSRRAFVRVLGAGGAGTLLAPAFAARGLEAARAEPGLRLPPDLIRLDSNENPVGPSPAALAALQAMLGEASRYPDDPAEELRTALAKALGTAPETVVLGCGSADILRIAVDAFTAANRPLVTAAPTFEQTATFATERGRPVTAVPVDRELRLDLDAMARASRGAGLVFLCNPNNPTGTVHGGDSIQEFIRTVHAASPQTVILVDEAYHEYVGDPAYRTMLPLAKENPRVVVTRTFSKVFGMAGLRAGYAVSTKETAETLNRFRLPNSVNVLAAAAAQASLSDSRAVAREVARNREAREFTRRLFEEFGCTVGPSEANFILADIRRDVPKFRAACRERGVAVGRPFPPLTTHLRVSIGTMPEMQRAAEVFRTLLRT